MALVADHALCASLGIRFPVPQADQGQSVHIEPVHHLLHANCPAF